jgi:putative membrane protein insertion efficiency factor
MRVPPRLASWLLVAAIGAAFAWDATRPPARQWTARAAVGAIRLYQRTASPLMPSVGVICRFTPTCSHYAAAVLERHGILRGTALTVGRLARCGPWTKSGTHDPPP